MNRLLTGKPQHTERQLVAAKREITELNRRLAAATTVIASLHHDNQMLRTESEAAGAVIALRGPV